MKLIFSFFIALFCSILSLNAQAPSCEAKCFSGNCQNGFGKYQYSNCVVYEGFFKDSKQNGKGKYLYTTGDIYDGEFNMGNREGFGKFKWTDGTRYEGDWKADVMNGKGTIWYANGDRYVGECYNSNREGKGIHYNANGTVEFDGYWKNNEKVTSAATTTTTEDTADNYDYGWLDEWLGEYNDETEEKNKEEEPAAANYTGEKTQGTSSGNFCTDYKAVSATAIDGYKSITGSKRSEEGEMFKTTVYNTTQSIAGADDCYIQNVLGVNYYAVFAESISKTVAEAKYNELENKIKSCFTDKLFQSGATSDYVLKSLSIIEKFPDGFNIFGDNLDLCYDKETGNYFVRLYISTNAFNHRVYKINYPGGSGDASFDSNLKKIMESSRTEFSSVLGDKHVSNGFMGTITSYDINASLPDIFDLSYSTGGFTLGENSMEGINYEGKDETEAKNRYNNLAEKVKKALGQNYVFIREDTDTETLKHKFALKNEIKDDKTPVVTVEYRYDDYSKKYTVKILFSYKDFGGIF